MTDVETVDGNELVVDALENVGVTTIYGVVGIPVTDLARTAQARGLRYLGFRNEQAAGHAAAAAGFLTGRPASVSRCPRQDSSTGSLRSRTPPPTVSR